jgi:hypothetical protein
LGNHMKESYLKLKVASIWMVWALDGH